MDLNKLPARNSPAKIITEGKLPQLSFPPE
jgi:hypothetical protein